MYNKDEIKQSLTIEQIFDLVCELGGEPYPIKDGYFCSRTICHNPAGEGSHKLYYYNNTQLFRCFTECENEGAFDIFELIAKVKKVNDNVEWTLYNCVSFVANYFGYVGYDYEFGENQEQLQDWKKIQSYVRLDELKDNKRIIELKIYDDSILKYLPKPRIIPWEQEGISKEVMDSRGICYYPVNESIIIPHYDIDNNLVGIRQRTLIRENEKYAKYMPARINNKLYSHPLSFNLYNLNNSKENIRVLKKAIIFESEKATLQYSSYFGIKNDISVAVCGSSLISYQVQLLLALGVKELVIALDKQFEEIGDKNFKKWTKKLTQINDNYSRYCKVSFLFDKWDLLGFKDSPIDRGKDIFLELFKRRIYL